MSSLETSEPSYPEGATFGDLLFWHLSHGTRPDGSVGRPGKPWTTRNFADVVGVTETSVRSWIKKRGRPSNLRFIEQALFDTNTAFERWRHDLRKAYSSDKVSGDLEIGGNIKVGQVLGDTQITTADANIVVAVADVTASDIVTGHDTNIGRDREISNPKTVISSEQALGRIADAVRLNLDQLQLNMEQARRESSQFFRTTMIFSGIAFAIILFGVVLMLEGLVTAGIVTAAASIIPQAGALLLFNKDKELRKTIESYHGHILDSQRTLTMIDLAETIAETYVKDSVKEQIIFSVLKITPAK